MKVADIPTKPDTRQDFNSLPLFLSVKQLASLLHINEKKIYQLAAEGDIPCTKVTGKWIFPTRLIEDWINENSHGGVMTDKLIIVGADDSLVDGVCREAALEYRDSGLLSYAPCGVLHGLRMLDSERADACCIHWGNADPNAIRHLGLLRGYRNHKRWVLVRCFQRQQGFALSPTLSTEYSAKANTSSKREMILADTRLRWATRHAQSGTHRLMQDMLAELYLSAEKLNTSVTAMSEQQAIAAVGRGLADVSLVSEVAAQNANLHFIATSRVSIDLVMTRDVYFRTMMQQLLQLFLQFESKSANNNFKGYFFPLQQQLLTVQ